MSRPRIGIVALLQETNTFLAAPTTLEHFQQNVLAYGDEVRQQFSGAEHEVGGFLARLDEADCEVVPIFAARALPYGTMTDDAYRTLRSRLLGAMEAAGRLDGVLAACHGATVSETVRDVDGDWLAEVREMIAPETPLIATADPHGNLSHKMVNAVDGLIAYRTNPHVDQRDRGIEAADLILRSIAEEVRPVTAATFLPLVMSIDRQCTEEEPCRSLAAKAQAIVQRPEVLSTSLFLGFPYADVPEMGSAIAVVADDDYPEALILADKFARVIWERRKEFLPDLIDVDQAIESAVHATDKPVLLLDMGDNVGGGSAGDGTVLAERLHRRKVRAFVCLYDPESVERAQQAGVGNRCELTMGGKTDTLHGSPLKAEVLVEKLSEGRFVEPEPRHGGQREFDQGPTAIVVCDPGLTIMLTSRRMAPFSLCQLTDLGVEPTSFDVIVAKGVNAPIAAYREVCPTQIRVNTPGATTADLMQLDYQHRRRPMFPFDAEASG